MVREALRQGINYIDVAPWYGHGLAEKVLGKVYYINIKYLQCERKCKTRVFFFHGILCEADFHEVKNKMFCLTSIRIPSICIGQILDMTSNKR